MEIKPQELRIGNLVLYNGNQVTIDGVRLRWMQRCIQSQMPNNTEGIELTPEWLKRFGFKQGDNISHSNSFYFIALGVSELSINPDNGVCWITNRIGSINNPLSLDFVHQVQNLFHALTGEELAIDKTSLKN